MDIYLDFIMASMRLSYCLRSILISGMQYAVCAMVSLCFANHVSYSITISLRLSLHHNAYHGIPLSHQSGCPHHYHHPFRHTLDITIQATSPRMTRARMCFTKTLSQRIPRLLTVTAVQKLVGRVDLVIEDLAGIAASSDQGTASNELGLTLKRAAGTAHEA